MVHTFLSLQIMEHIILDGFNIYFLIAILGLCLATYFSLRARFLSFIGFQQFVDYKDDFTVDLSDEGRDIMLSNGVKLVDSRIHSFRWFAQNELKLKVEKRKRQRAEDNESRRRNVEVASSSPRPELVRENGGKEKNKLDLTRRRDAGRYFDPTFPPPAIFNGYVFTTQYFKFLNMSPMPNPAVDEEAEACNGLHPTNLLLDQQTSPQVLTRKQRINKRTTRRRKEQRQRDALVGRIAALFLD